jgi:hypothetical protein
VGVVVHTCDLSYAGVVGRKICLRLAGKKSMRVSEKIK